MQNRFNFIYFVSLRVLEKNITGKEWEIENEECSFRVVIILNYSFVKDGIGELRQLGENLLDI